MSDLFHEAVPDALIDRVFAVMALCPQHTLQVLTKRSARMRAYLTAPSFGMRIGGELMRAARGHAGAEAHVIGLTHRLTVQGLPLPNCWLGVSTEDQRRADERIPDLLATPAAVRFVSAEPLLGPIDLTGFRTPGWPHCERINALTGGGRSTNSVWLGSDKKLGWVIVGGESGPNARPLHPAWSRSILAQCTAAGVAFLFKQHGALRPVAPIHDHDDRSAKAWLNADERRCVMVCDDGRIWPDGFDAPPAGAWMMERVGKKAAGRLLDGVEHNGMPGARHG